MDDMLWSLDSDYLQAAWSTRCEEWPTVAECYDLLAAYCGYPL